MWMYLAEKVGLVLIQNVSRILAGYQMTGNTGLIQIMLKIVQVHHKMLLSRDLITMQLRSASVNKVQIGEHTTRPFNAMGYIRNNDTLSWIKS